MASSRLQPLSLLLIVALAAPHSAAVQCHAPCTCRAVASTTVEGSLSVIIAESRNPTLRVSTVRPGQVYRVRMQVLEPFQEFFVCSTSRSGRSGGDFPRRYLPGHAQWLGACENFLTSGSAFRRRPGSIGEMQFRWRAPRTAPSGQCSVITVCIQLSSGRKAGSWVTRSLTLCPVEPTTQLPTTMTTQQPSTEPSTTMTTQQETTETPTTRRPVEPLTTVLTTQPHATSPPQTPRAQTIEPPFTTMVQQETTQPSQSLPFEALSRTTRPSANSAMIPVRMPIDYPGPVEQTAFIHIKPYGLKEEAKIFVSDGLYEIDLSSNQQFTTCFLAVVVQPSTANMAATGEIVGKALLGPERRHQSYPNVIDCTAGARTSSKVFWRSPGNSSSCVEIRAWIEVKSGKAMRIDKPLCRLYFRGSSNGCPSGVGRCKACRVHNSLLYFLYQTPFEPQCCNGYPVGPNQQCCGATIQPRNENTYCCGNRTTVDRNEGTCCRGNKQLGRVRGFFCCATRAYSYSAILAGGQEPRCCGKQAYDPTRQLCCGNNLRDTWPGVPASQMHCCPWNGAAFNTLTHSCVWCRGSSERHIQPQGIPLRCCGRKAYNSSTSVCCNEQMEDLRPSVSRNSECCAGQVYDRQQALCCLNQVAEAPPGQRVTPEWRCCDDKAYNPQTHNCLVCLGFRRLVRWDESWSCCGINAFSRLSSICCNGRVLPLPVKHRSLLEMPSYGCCGDKAFDPQTRTCCSAERSAVVSGVGTGCCGLNRVFNAAIGESCRQCPGGEPVVTQPTDNHICCGSQLYNERLAACCMNPPRPVRVARPISVAPRLLCCNGTVAYDAQLEQCCSNGRLVVAGMPC